ncbi:autotransporter domain-containing protein [Bradyrhizobium ontarionense]|uniref:Autotransporter domain-containing protein n=1 Tax=Bradyrhizobium ontarionense TaxID=2898149 RepID=A0ABY3RAC1_9BRAD|nr:autotransporter outer membrane beta-barrel domain-containing protein [Bradyrhizobium sp. A19]UFZ04325.1 autotransporter domain-containing protein [Bradyrhizobium sp. A19]
MAQTSSGGDGGNASQAGGFGGTSSATGTGSDGTAGSNLTQGGGGGGAGITGGSGGSDYSGAFHGGNGGLSAGASGSPGQNGGGTSSGGGGGGGAHGAVATTDGSNTATITGGNGGRGGSASNSWGGGGGGAGGYGVVVDGSGLTYTNTGLIGGGIGAPGGVANNNGHGGNGGDGGYGVYVTGPSVLTNSGAITGGAGGNGGDALNSTQSRAGGDGGNGGIGVYFTSGGTLINSGSITGGAAGVRGLGQTGAYDGIFGSAGDGVRGANLTIVNSGTISAGTDLLGPVPPNAITFTGGSNVLEIWASSIINGNVAGTGTDTLRLGGAANGTFDVSSIGASAQYRGFSNVAKTGAGTWTLTGTTTAVTPWAINQGTLEVSSDANLGGSSGALTFGGGTLRYLAGFSSNRDVTLNAGGGSFDTNGNDATLGGTISGTGRFTKLGAGTLTLSNTSNVSYSGDTFINAGTLRAGAPGVLSFASAYTVASGATLDLNGFSSMIGSLAGSGSVLLGAGSLTAGGNDGSTTFAGTISGTGGFIKTGTGRTTLTGTSSYTGATIINGGVLDIEGAITNTSGVSVNPGGTLMGAGLVDPPMTVSINAGGTLAPGNGTAGSSMTIVGNLAFQSGAYYLVQLDPTAASFASVTGSATLGGATVNAVFGTGGYVDKRYTILTTSGGISGSFGSVVKTNLPSGFKTSLSYDATNVYLDLILAFALPGGLNGNQKAVGSTLSAFFDRTGDIPLVFGRLNQAGLTQATGESATGVQQTTFNAMSQFAGLLTDPFAQRQGGGGTNGYADTTRKRTDAFAMLPDDRPADFAQRWNVWAAGFGGSQSTSGNASVGSNGTTSRIAGTAVGADYRLAPQTIAGFALGGSGTSFSVNGLGSGRSDLFQAGAYLHYYAGPNYLRAALAYGWQDVTTDRTVTISGTDGLRASYQANAWTGRIEGGTRFVAPLGGVGLTPYAAAQVTSLRLPAYVEQATVGASTFALSYAGKTVTATRSELGLRTDKSYALADCALTLRGRLAWAHDFNPDRSVSATFQTLPGASFVVNGAAQARDSALTATSIEMSWLNGWSAMATFESEISNVTRSYSGKGTVRYAW